MRMYDLEEIHLFLGNLFKNRARNQFGNRLRNAHNATCLDLLYFGFYSILQFSNKYLMQNSKMN